MSVNISTYLKFIHTPITADAAYEQLSTENKFVYGLIIGVDDDSASATTGNWVGTSASVTVSNKDGVKITAAQPLSVGGTPNGHQMLAVNLADYFVATTSGDLIYVSYLEETAIT